MHNKIKIKKALISVFDKTNILDVSKFLISQKVEIYSSGGTYKFLKEKHRLTPENIVEDILSSIN